MQTLLCDEFALEFALSFASYNFEDDKFVNIVSIIHISHIMICNVECLICRRTKMVAVAALKLFRNSRSYM